MPNFNQFRIWKLGSPDQPPRRELGGVNEDGTIYLDGGFNKTTVIWGSSPQLFSRRIYAEYLNYVEDSERRIDPPDEIGPLSVWRY